MITLLEIYFAKNILHPLSVHHHDADFLYLVAALRALTPKIINEYVKINCFWRKVVSCVEECVHEEQSLQFQRCFPIFAGI